MSYTKAELPITVRTPQELLDALDRFRASFEDNPTRPEAIRRVLENYLVMSARG
ncbi:MAG: hypothetical protein KDK24_03045 [Pseudooceanicola sp.]|nr:hypothetical protein [Pseudooceanicola sp.]